MKVFCSILLCCFFTLISPKVLACQCPFGKSEILTAYKNSDAVFVGKVISLRNSNSLKKYGIKEEQDVRNQIPGLKSNNKYKKRQRKLSRKYKKYVIVKMRILKILKGKYTSKIITVYSTNSSCGFHFDKNEEYLIYGDWENGIIFQQMCHRSKVRNLEEEKQVEKLQELSKSTFFEIKGSRHEIIGDFNGDKIMDTLKEYFIDQESNKETFKYLETIDTTKNVNDSIVKFYQQRKIDSYLSFGMFKLNLDELGIYYLKNIGDINHDGNDEIALIVNQNNSNRGNKDCLFYTFKENKWDLIFKFTTYKNSLSTIDKLGNLINGDDSNPFKKINDSTFEIYSYENKEFIIKQITF